MRAHLHERLDRVDNDRIDEVFTAGGYVDDAGVPFDLGSPFVPGQRIWFHRDLPVEVPVPFDIDVLHVDDRIVVIDKPHFLATIPRGQHIRETALVRARQQLGLPELAPAHRLDRATAGVLLFTTRREWRGRYQNIFRDRLADKQYLAVAGVRDDLELPLTVRSHIVKERGVLRAYEVPGQAPNAETRVELLTAVHGDIRDAGTTSGRGCYRLTPFTGRTHQLRLHLSGLGIPILGDPFYPELTDVPRDDFSSPLQLLAESLAFPDPVDGTRREFRSRRSLTGWPTDPQIRPSGG